MRKLILLAVTLLWLTSCGVYHDANLENISLTSKEKSFIAAFEDAAVKHKVRALKSMLHPIYIDQELNEMYGGNARLLFNEFFCGKDVNTKKFYCLKLRNVREIHLVKVSKGEEKGEKRLLFKVVGYDHTILVELYMKTYSKNGQARIGIIGAFG